MGVGVGLSGAAVLPGDHGAGEQQDGGELVLTQPGHQGRRQHHRQDGAELVLTQPGHQGAWGLDSPLPGWIRERGGWIHRYRGGFVSVGVGITATG
eukprot:6194016-Pyramimonas_sp.AAC.1